MRRTAQLQGLRLMKFEEVYDQTARGTLSQAKAAEILGLRSALFGAGETAMKRKAMRPPSTGRFADDRFGSTAVLLA